jgi:PEP-CTERM motif
VSKRSGFLKVGISSLVLSGMVYATPITLTKGTTTSFNTQWQDIAGVSASYIDVNSNSVLEVGEKVTFTVDMHKNTWGVHDFDALKIWIDDAIGTNLMSDTGTWDFDKGVDNSSHYVYDNKVWTGGDKFFTFDYTFQTAGTYNFVASVMCNDDLRKLANPTETVDQLDWNKWTENTVHPYQGETERYSLKVSKQDVPEPSSFSLMVLGLTTLGGALFMRRKKK